jgi:hypothetical protein
MQKVKPFKQNKMRRFLGNKLNVKTAKEQLGKKYEK